MIFPPNNHGMKGQLIMLNVSQRYSMPPDTIKTNNRRIYHHLREIFEEAYNLAAPFLDPRQGWGGRPMVHHAYGALRNAYPHLAAQDFAILVPTLARTFRERTDQELAR
jgi:hypothetical protein